MPDKVGSVWHRTIAKPHTRGVAKSPDPCNNTFKRDNPAQPQRIMLKGTELLDAIRSMETASRTEQCLACGYVRENGKPAFTNFYEAILEARGVITNAQELKAENVDYQEQIDELLEDYDADAIRAFIELYGEENLESFSDAYQGEYESGAHFAESMVEDCYALDIPAFVCIDWEATWDQLYYDYSIEDGYVFCDNF